MLRFKEFLKEYLTDEQRKKYADIEMTPEARKNTDHFFGHGVDGVREDIKNYTPDKSEIHKKIENHIGQEISHEDYAKGLVKDKYGRDVKIGKLIKDDNLRNQFTSDPIREGIKKAKSHYVTIVRGTEVAGQTNGQETPEHPNGHSWKDISCKNVDNGSNRGYLVNEIKHGTVVMRVHDHNNQEIYRATLHPFYNKKGSVMYNLDAEYGVKHPSFTNHAKDVAERLSGDDTNGVFRIHPSVYNDSRIFQRLHNKVDLVKASQDTSVDPKLIVAHPNYTSQNEKVVNNLLKRKKDLNLTTYEKMIEDKKTPTKIVDDIYKNHGWKGVAAAAAHPNLSQHHLDGFFNNYFDPDNKTIDRHNKDSVIRHMLNPNVKDEHSLKFLGRDNKIDSNSSKSNVLNELMWKGKVKEHHILEYLKNTGRKDTYEFRALVRYHSKPKDVFTERVNKEILKLKNPDLTHDLVSDPDSNIPSTNLSNILKSPEKYDKSTLVSVMRHKNTKVKDIAEHLDKYGGMYHESTLDRLYNMFGIAKTKEKK